MGCILLMVFPPFCVSENLCACIAMNPSWHPSDVTMNDDLSKQGALRMGSDIRAIFRAGNAC